MANNSKGTGGTADTSTGTTVTSSSTNVTLAGATLNLDSKVKLTIPKGYYSSAITVQNGGTGVTSGSFTGSGDKTITLGFQPSAVTVTSSIYNTYAYMLMYDEQNTTHPLIFCYSTTNNAAGGYAYKSLNTAWIHDNVTFKFNVTSTGFMMSTNYFSGETRYTAVR